MYDECTITYFVKGITYSLNVYMILAQRLKYTHKDRKEGMACTISFDTGLTSAEGQMLECFQEMTKKILEVL